MKGGFKIRDCGLICVDKPCDYSSFDVIRKLRKIININKIGHAGTLDPMATGVLPVFFGRATKAIQYIKDTDKEYTAKFKFGIETTTLDITGEIVEKKESNIERKEVEETIKKFEGKIDQIPPMYSAVKINGTPLYKLARKGKVVERKKRTITIKKIECLNFDEEEQEGILKIYCSSGTYIRSLVFDIGRELKVGAVLTKLRRTKACGFSIDNCFSLQKLEQLKEKKDLDSAVIGVEYIFKDFETIQLDEKSSELFLNGVSIKLDGSYNFSYKIAVYSGKKLLGIAHKEGEILKIDRVLI